MSLILNLIWFVLGGFVSGCAWLLAALLLAFTIVGLPWSMAAARIGLFTFFPFGQKVVDRETITGHGDLGTGPAGCLLNIIWFVLGGWYVALAHLIIGALLCLPIITIPFALQHFKLAGIAMAPVGKTVIPT
ncbi:MAG: hypothetical protein RLZZ141_1033 [Pseudomonadota bacterium]